MRRATNFLFFLLILAGAGCMAASQGVEAASPKHTWTFIDLNSGASSFISNEPGRIVVGEEGIGATFCSRESSFYCFASDWANFAVPRSMPTSESWHVDGRIYCVVNRFHEGRERSNEAHKTWLIFSRRGDTCSGSTPFDLMIVFSPKKGLRQLQQKLKEGGTIELLSSDEVGFGSVLK